MSGVHPQIHNEVHGSCVADPASQVGLASASIVTLGHFVPAGCGRPILKTIHHMFVF